ncbi:TIR domain-containing protein [Accumulibacter sp.]|uniref:TIR domain-containing protein n=1 Tax=Accumulibacter sp. TaxID=2053492 RepID=UPI0035B49D3A
MAPRKLMDCNYSVFVSYAQADDLAWNSWVTCFMKELNMTLRGRVRMERKIPPIFQDRKNGPVAGDLQTQLRESIAASFAMILIVHDNYGDSGWCQKELEYFKSLFNNDGFLERLYIVALSKDAIDNLTATAKWKALCPTSDQIWMPFYQDDEPNIPLDIYSDKGIVATEFWRRFVRLREDLATKIRRSLDDSKEQAAGPEPDVQVQAGAATDAIVLPRAAAVDDYEWVRIYIESNQNEVDHWESVGAQIRSSWEKVIAGMRLAPPLYVRPYGLPMDKIDQYPRLDDADGVVLLWGQKTADSLVAQINTVERKLPGPDLAPGVVAYLMPPHALSEQRVSALGWRVLRFTAPSGGDVKVTDQDSPGLETFLREVLERRKQRQERHS